MPNTKMGIDDRYVYLRVQFERYRVADSHGKSDLLSAMSALRCIPVTALIALMRREPQRHPRSQQRMRSYGAEAQQLIRIIDRALDHPCRERLKPMLPLMADHLQQLGVLEYSVRARAQLEAISVSSIGRLLERIRQDDHRVRCRAVEVSVHAIQAQAPIRRIPWDEVVPGHYEVDLVHHSGPYASGEFVYTLQMMDIATGWSELVAILGRSYRVMRDGFERCLARRPFPVLEVHTDNGSEFLNAHMLAFWREKYAGVFLSRTRPYHSQDNRFVEHRNGALVRALLGHDRFDTARQTRQLSWVYGQVRHYLSFFQPMMRHTEKTNLDGRTLRKYKDLGTPFQRALDSHCMPGDTGKDLQLDSGA